MKNKHVQYYTKLIQNNRQIFYHLAIGKWEKINILTTEKIIIKINKY